MRADFITSGECETLVSFVIVILKVRFKEQVKRDFLKSGQTLCGLYKIYLYMRTHTHTTVVFELIIPFFYVALFWKSQREN